jgi:hypothetical protein
MGSALSWNVKVDQLEDVVELANSVSDCANCDCRVCRLVNSNKYFWYRSLY